MRINEILNCTDHRPWNIPEGNWKFYQEWNNVVFLHWEVNLEELRKFVPKELEIDLIERTAWVSLVAFTMENIRPKYIPSWSPISNFDEINIRTYVKYKGKPGVYFLSIEGGSILSCQIATNISNLPYRYSRMNRQEGSFNSENKSYNEHFRLNYKINEANNKKDKVDLWLTERYALFQQTEKAILKYEIHHIEWPIYHVNINKLEFSYGRFNKLLIGQPTRIAFSYGVKVLAWGKNKFS